MILKSVKFRAALLTLAIILSAPMLSAQNSSAPGLHTVVIDPGHGGKDPGAPSRDKKSQEKSFVLDISKRLKADIEAACPDVKVLLTRDDDKYIPLIDRAKFATKNNADVFISVHINASDRSTSVNGYSVHLLGPSDKSKNTYAYNMEVCKRENEVILLEDDYTTTYEGFDPNNPESDILLHLMHNSYREQSLLFAQIVDQKLKSGPFKKSNGIYQNNFAVLRLATMPAMLLELGFISSNNDLTTLRNKDARANLAARLCEAFCEYKTLYDESVGAGNAAAGKSSASAQPAEASAKTSTASGKTSAAADASNSKASSAAGKSSSAAVTDSSEVSAKKSAAAETVGAAEQKTSADNPAAPTASGPVYATQILATTVKKDSDDKIFLGYTPVETRSGKLYRYYIGVSSDVSKAKEYYQIIRKTYADAFFVKLENGSAQRVK